MSEAQEREAVALLARVLAGATAAPVGRRRGLAGGSSGGMGGAFDGAGRHRGSGQVARRGGRSARVARPEIGRRS